MRVTTRREISVVILLFGGGWLFLGVGCDSKKEKTVLTEAPATNAVPAAATVRASTPVRAAAIHGKVTLSGTPPAPQTIKMDAACGALHPTPVTDTPYRVGPNGGLANTFVYIKTGLSGKKFEAPAETPLLDQEGCLYKPPLLVVWAGQKFKVRNSDGLIHNVHAMPTRNKEFNVGQPLKGQVTEKVFAEPEILVRIMCNFHPWMSAHIAVVDHPYYAVTDQDGQFRLPAGITPGSYTLVAHHPKAGMVSQEIKLAPGEEKNVSFTLAVK